MFSIFCAICDFEAQCLDNLINHIKQTHEEIRSPNQNKKKIQKLVKPDNYENVIECVSCSILFHTKLSFLKHQKEVQRQIYQCFQCFSTLKCNIKPKRHKNKNDRKTKKESFEEKKASKLMMF